MAENSRTKIAAIVLLDAAALVVLRPRSALLGDVTHPHHWLAGLGADAAAAQLAAALLWLVAGWVGMGLLACGLGTVPGGAGRTAERFARLVLPRAVYRLAAAAAGLGIALTPVAATADPPPHAHPVATAPQWPTDRSGTPHAPGWPTPPRSARPRPEDSPARAAPHPTGRTNPPRADSAPVVVHVGDSLWQIAAAHLPGRSGARRVAAAWPRWYAANRRVIGDDPNLIQPGAVLRPPTEGSSS